MALAHSVRHPSSDGADGPVARGRRRRAFARFGRGRHKAGLNLGDCASTLAMTQVEPLFKGMNLAATGVEVVRLGGDHDTD